MVPNSKYAFLQQAFTRDRRSRSMNRDYFFQSYRTKLLFRRVEKSSLTSTQKTFSSAVRRFIGQLALSIPHVSIRNILSYLMTEDRGSLSRTKYLLVFCNKSCKLNSSNPAPVMSSSTTSASGKRNTNVIILFVNVNDIDQFQQSPPAEFVSLMGKNFEAHYFTISQVDNIRNLFYQ